MNQFKLEVIKNDEELSKKYEYLISSFSKLRENYLLLKDLTHSFVRIKDNLKSKYNPILLEKMDKIRSEVNSKNQEKNNIQNEVKLYLEIESKEMISIINFLSQKELNISIEKYIVERLF